MYCWNTEGPVKVSGIKLGKFYLSLFNVITRNTKCIADFLGDKNLKVVGKIREDWEGQ